MKTRVAALLGAFAIVLAGCTVDGGSSDDSSAGGGEGMPDTITPIKARQAVYDTMQGKKIAFVPILYKGYNLTTEWGHTMERSFERMGAEFKVYDSNFDTDQMVKTINDLIAREAVDVLVLHNPDVGVLTQQIEDAADAGIYTVVINMISNASGDIFVGADVVGSAEDVAERAVTDCESRGAPKQVAVIDGPGNDAFSLQWNAGISNTFEEHGYEVVRTSHAQWQNSLANKAAMQILQQQKDNICAFMVTFDLNAIAVGDAVQDAERQGLIQEGSIGVYTMAAGAETCAAMDAGKVTATAAYDVTGIGSSIVAGTQQLLEMGNEPGSMHTISLLPHVVVDKTTMNEYTIACYTGN
ncbi:MAG: substrate-binding domain-containing protein [Propionibacteriales bacterium]|nr:substrate-binding domain-containing protein [Propionibacteriales bacterium]